MKQKHKDELRSLRYQIEDLVLRHEALTRSVNQLRTDHDHQCQALAQRGIWDHDYSAEHKPKLVVK